MTETVRPSWLEFAGAHVSLARKLDGGRDRLIIRGNPQGLGSVAAALAWLGAYSDPSALSLSALPYVRATGSLALSVVLTNSRTPYQGRLTRTDRDAQFEWQIEYTSLCEVGSGLFRTAVLDDSGEYFEPALDPSSDAGLIFEVS